MYKNIRATDLKGLVGKVNIIDIRKNYLYNIGNIPSSKNIPSSFLLMNPDKYLDINHLNVFLKAIRTIKRRYKKTIIIFSNDSDFVHMIADYMFVIDKSGVLKEGNKYDVFSDVKIIKDLHLDLPKIIHLENLVLKEKKIDIGFRDNINDLIKDIYYFSN